DFAGAKLYKPSHLRVLLLDILNSRSGIEDSYTCCHEAIGWLFNAQDAYDTGGISAGYSFNLGWLPPYPETSGYIIPTLLKCARYLDTPIKDECRERALKIANWLVEIQLESGAYEGGPVAGKKKTLAHRLISINRKPMVFDTGQVIRGLLAAYEETGEQRYLETSMAGADWMAGCQNNDGSWTDFTYNDIGGVYHTYVDWPLIRLSQIYGERRFEETARRNLNWALSRQTTKGWFKNNAFFTDKPPLSHTIGYATDGLLECGILIGNNDYVQAATRAAEALRGTHWIEQGNGLFPGTLNEDWESKAHYSCLTGNAQISIIFLKLYEITRDRRYLSASGKINNTLKAIQNIAFSNPGTRGGIKGSLPVYGDYMAFTYPCWATKYYIDALLLEEVITYESVCAEPPVSA
ncbi:beta-L-arabinofuranosidase domain-containing protein, partial [Chloroflexota bacterium]